MKKDKILEYRIVETDKGFRIEKEDLVNEGFLLWPIYGSVWMKLDLEGRMTYYSDTKIHYYRTLEEATIKLCQFKNPKYIVHKVEC
jgi:hypothetical protein